MINDIFSSCLRLSAHAYGSVMLIEIMSYPMPRKSLIYWSETMPLHPLFICLIHYENILVLFQRLLKNARVTVPCFQNIRTQYYFSVCLCLSFTFSFNWILHFWYMVNWISSVWSFVFFGVGGYMITHHSLSKVFLVNARHLGVGM